MKMSEEELFQYEQILNQETLDIFNYITAKNEVPEVEKRKAVDATSCHVWFRLYNIVSPI